MKGGETLCATDAEECGLVVGAGDGQRRGAGGYVRFVSVTGSDVNCVKPITRGMHVFGCGQCIPCLIKRRRQWAHRLMLEAAMHEDCSFVTLTYEDSKLPRVKLAGSADNNCTETGLPTLSPSDLNKWLKRFRWAVSPSKIRFYAAGEYGDENWRPHYHLAIFGFPSCYRGLTLGVEQRKRPNWRGCCDVCRLVGETWERGDIVTGELSFESAQYVAGYVTKKMTRKDDERLLGRVPEFSRQSRWPGIGVPAVPDIAAACRAAGWSERNVDVPHTLRHGDRELPLGRYMRAALRLELGMLKGAPKEAMLAVDPKLLDLRMAARADAAQPSFTRKVSEAYKGKVASALARNRIWKKERSL